MKNVEITHSKHIIPYTRFLLGNGEPVERLLRQAGLPITCLEDAKTPLPTAALWQFRELAAVRTGLPNLTLNVVADMQFADLGAIADAVASAPTLLKMLQVFVRLVRTETSTATLDLQPCACDGIYFVDRLALRNVQGEWHAELYVFLWMLKMVQLVDPMWSPTEIWFVSKANPDRVRAIESLGAKPRFGECCTAFPIPASMLALPPKSCKCIPGNRNCEEEHLWSAAPSDTFSGAVRQLIRAYAGGGWLSVKEASEVAGTSIRTMQRRLCAGATTYSSLLEEVRAELAGNLLENTDAPMSEISEQLGYGDPGNFTRAFCRWAGVPPTVFRAQRRAMPG
jgi:AraC-like DNA-binding protein